MTVGAVTCTESPNRASELFALNAGGQVIGQGDVFQSLAYYQPIGLQTVWP